MLRWSRTLGQSRLGNRGPAFLANDGTSPPSASWGCLWRRRLDDFWDWSLNVRLDSDPEDEDRLLPSEMAYGRQAQGLARHIVDDARKLAWRGGPEKGCYFDRLDLAPRHKVSQIILVVS